MSDICVYDCMAQTFWDVYDDLKEGRHAEYWLKGGRASSKSSFISLAIVRGILADPFANALIYRKVGNTIKDSVYSQILWAIERLGLTPWFRCKLSPFEIICVPTGQRILFRGADDPMKSKSLKLQRGYFKYLWFEELAEFRCMEDIRVIQQSALRGVNHACTLYSYNPPRSAQSWVNAEALRPTKDRLVHHSTYLNVPPEWLGEAFLQGAESLREANPRAWQNEYMGEVTGTGGQVFDNLQMRLIDDAELDVLDVFYNGLDFGFAVDPDAFVRWAYDRKHNMLAAVSEFYGAKNSIDSLADAVKQRAGREIVRCDSADPRMIAELKRRGIQATGVKKGPGSVEHGVRWLENRPGIIIDPARTPNIAREFLQYEYAQDRHGNFLSEYPDRDNHSIDATRYALEPEIGRRVATTRRDIY